MSSGWWRRTGGPHSTRRPRGFAPSSHHGAHDDHPDHTTRAAAHLRRLRHAVEPDTDLTHLEAAATSPDLDRFTSIAPPQRRYRVALAAGVVRGTVARGDDTAAFVMFDRLRDLVVPNPTADERARWTVFDIAAGRWVDYIALAHQCEVWARDLLEHTGTDELDCKVRACAEAFGHPEWCEDPPMPKTKKPNKGGRPRFARPSAGSLPARIVRSYDRGHRTPSEIRKDLDLTAAEGPRVYKALDRYRPKWRESQ